MPVPPSQNLPRCDQSLNRLRTRLAFNSAFLVRFSIEVLDAWPAQVRKVVAQLFKFRLRQDITLGRLRSASHDEQNYHVRLLFAKAYTVPVRRR